MHRLAALAVLLVPQVAAASPNVDGLTERLVQVELGVRDLLHSASDHLAAIARADLRRSPDLTIP